MDLALTQEQKSTALGFMIVFERNAESTYVKIARSYSARLQIV